MESVRLQVAWITLPKAPDPRTLLRVKSERNKDEFLALVVTEGEKEETEGGKGVKVGRGGGMGKAEGRVGTWHLGLSLPCPQMYVSVVASPLEKLDLIGCRVKPVVSKVFG